MTLAEVLTFIHVVAVIVWIGGSFIIGLLIERSERSRDEAGVKNLLRESDFIGKAVFNPAGVITLAAGIWLVIELDGVEFSEAWISIGFAGIALGAVLGMAFYPKAIAGALAAIEEDGLLGNAALARLRRLRLVSSIGWVLLIVVVWAMIFKPGG